MLSSTGRLSRAAFLGAAAALLALAMAFEYARAALGVDARWGWRIRPGVELSIIGQNLFDPRHAEFGAPATRSEYERALAVRVVWTP